MALISYTYSCTLKGHIRKQEAKESLLSLQSQMCCDSEGTGSSKLQYGSE